MKEAAFIESSKKLHAEYLHRAEGLQQLMNDSLIQHTSCLNKADALQQVITIFEREAPAAQPILTLTEIVSEYDARHLSPEARAAAKEANKIESVPVFDFSICAAGSLPAGTAAPAENTAAEEPAAPVEDSSATPERLTSVEFEQESSAAYKRLLGESSEETGAGTAAEIIPAEESAARESEASAAPAESSPAEELKKNATLIQPGLKNSEATPSFDMKEGLKVWTHKDEELLIKMTIENTHSSGEMAEILGRTISSIMQRRTKLYSEGRLHKKDPLNKEKKAKAYVEPGATRSGFF